MYIDSNDSIFFFKRKHMALVFTEVSFILYKTRKAFTKIQQRNFLHPKMALVYYTVYRSLNTEFLRNNTEWQSKDQTGRKRQTQCHKFYSLYRLLTSVHNSNLSEHTYRLLKTNSMTTQQLLVEYKSIFPFCLSHNFNI